MENWAKIRNYKCFGDDPQGFEEIKRFNIIIGRNNSGKSSLLDLLAFLAKPHPLTSTRQGSAPEVLRMGRVDDADYLRTFPNDTQRTDIGYFDVYGAKYKNKTMTWRVTENGANELLSIDDAPPIEAIFKRQIVAHKTHSLSGKIFKRLSAERDIRPEPPDEKLQLSENGSGATNIFQAYLNDSERPSDLIESTLLTALNEIFEPDALFTRLRVQRLQGEIWEIFLDERDKGRVSLTDSGSGVKTALLVLRCVLVLPHIESRPLNAYVFAFEELENYAHPALQRRLLLYLHRLAVASDLTLFLTTHSTVAIDFFSRDPDSQILHVVHDGRESRVEGVRAYEQNGKILDDLDLRASDIFQSNGIVWLEGPSDRLYFRRWIDLWSHGKLVEGVHYQCLFYGGKLLKHISCDEPDCDPARVHVLTVNRNAMIVIDSDIRVEGKTLNNTKLRIIEELERVGGVAWVTAGKEVENYIPPRLLSSLLGVDISGLSTTTTVWDIANETEKGLGNKLKRDKVGLAERIVPQIERSDLEVQLDMPEMMPKLCERISRWNAITL